MLRILKAAGGQIDPFWAMYAQHNVASVKEILGEHRIGHLSALVLQRARSDGADFRVDRWSAHVEDMALTSNSSAEMSSHVCEDALNHQSLTHSACAFTLSKYKGQRVRTDSCHPSHVCLSVFKGLEIGHGS